jgi:hypothetical protein
VDGLVAAREWDDLLDLADACEHALERGKQLWPIVAHAEYRIALEGPAKLAVNMLGSPLNRFMLGPLTEVIASTHTWSEVADEIETPHDAAFIAHERVLRGEEVGGDLRAHEDMLDVPLRLFEWEPPYALATYRADHVEVAEPLLRPPALRDVDPQPGPIADDPALVEALLDLVAPWTTQSNGAARAVVVEGTALGAASALTGTRLRIAPMEGWQAMRWLAWAAASGGAHGRRRGAAFGRSATLHLLGMLVETPAEALDSIEWVAWDEGEPEKGWVLRLAFGSREEGWGAAIAATDLLEEDESGTT